MALPMRVTVSPDRVDADPGDAVNIEVTVRNTSDIVEHYVIDTLGLPDGAVAESEPAVTKLRPGETGTATVRLAVGKEPPATAGLYTLGVLVRSRYRDEVSRCEELPLTVAQVDSITVRVEPEVATGGRSAQYTVEVTNGGNTPARLRLSSTDPERKVTAAFRPPTVDLPPGAAARAHLSVHAAVPWNKEKQRALRVEAAGVGVKGDGAATFVQRPRFASKLTRIAGMVGAVLVLAGAVVTAALITSGGDEPSGSKPTPAASIGNSPAAPQSQGQPSNATSAAPSPTATAAPTSVTPSAPAVPTPRQIDLTRPGGNPADGVIPSDAFSRDGLILSGAPDPDATQCQDATAVAVRGEDASGRFLTAARPDDPAACNQIPVQIRFRDGASSVQLVVGGQGKRRMEVVYRDLSRTIETDLEASDDGRHGGIDYVVVRGLPEGPANPEPPPAAVQTLTFTPATS
jgi:hypothetical protein